MTHEDFFWDWSPEHPVRWSDGIGADQYLTVQHAAKRLARYGVLDARERLEAGETITTVVADYVLLKWARDEGLPTWDVGPAWEVTLVVVK